MENQEDNIIDDAAADETASSQRYEINSYGVDYDVEGIINRYNRGDIYIPPFQREYVWSPTDASRFIESLLLGLPVPGIFLARDDEKKLLVIDGQQRIKSLVFFFGGDFNPDEESTRIKKFRLTGVKNNFLDKTYKILEERDKQTLRDAIIHATIIQQDGPNEEESSSTYKSSTYRIFERLNSTGRKLTPQQIRVAVYFSNEVIKTLKVLNDNEHWRLIYGKNKSVKLKDEELILRFFAFYYFQKKYKPSLKNFLNESINELEKLYPDMKELKELFNNTIEHIYSALGEKAFRTERYINAAVLDSVMVGLSRRLSDNNLPPKKEKIKEAYNDLIRNSEYVKYISQSTGSLENVSNRIKMATDAFARL